jgi:hypothetical protein
VSSGSPVEASVGFSRGLRAGNHIVVAGLLDPRWLVEVERDAILDNALADPSRNAVGDEGSS